MLSRSATAAINGLLVLASVVLANPMHTPVGDLVPRQTITPGGPPCGQNNATNRGCWKNNWNISTDYETSYPPAFNTRVYDFHITNISSWVGPDGVTKRAMLINKQFPGPVIEADWGDYIQVNVYNDMQDNGTSIHWHGIRQFGESDQDGANGVTECPIPPGASKSYAFHVTQYGSSWYHSHYSSQYGNGIVGPIVVRGPSSGNWDIDLGPYMLTDYYYETADNLQRKAELVNGGGPPDSNNILFRGKNINPKESGGSYDKITLTPGKKHLLRLINTSVDNSLTVSLVGHNFTVIATDLVAVTPVVKNQLFLGVGQRYDVIIDANQKADNYWLNVTLEASNLCGRSLNPFPAAIVHYDGASNSNPTNAGARVSAGCKDELGFAPIVKRSLSSSSFQATTFGVSLDQPTEPIGKVFRWLVKNTPIVVEWDHPVLEYIAQGNTSFPAKINLVDVPQADQWTFWVIQNDFILPHPVHLHGHDFLLLGSGQGTFSNSMVGQLNFNNPIRRDVAQMPGSGWIVMAWRTDNPGCWLLHCHIGWHVSQGLGIQFLERKSEIKKLMHLEQLTPNCDAWRKYQPKAAWLPKLDSGLKRRQEDHIQLWEG